MSSKYIHHVLLYFSFLLILTNGVKAQVNANFTTVQTIGCSPLLVEFIDNSSGANITYRKWDFGNGNVSVGNMINPFVIYSNSGYYDVTLTVSNGVDTSVVTIANSVHVTVPPVPFFSVNINEGCAPLQFGIQNNSIAVDAPIVSYAWDFNDGSLLDTNQNVSHTYYTSGSFLISLIVTDSLGCSSSLTAVQPIIVYKPDARFSSQGLRYSCSTPFSVNILNNSIGTPPMTNNWSFNSNNHSTVDLNTVLNQPGAYDLELTVSDSFGCVDTLTVPNYINVGSTNTSMVIPDSTCRNLAETFTAIGLNASSYVWDFGDGQSASGRVVSHAYAYPGLFSVMLVVNNAGGCNDTLIQNIRVESVIADFTSSPHFACEAPMVVNFQDQSVGNIVSWDWGFGSKLGNATSNSTQQNPTDTIMVPGIYDDTLTVTTAFGCTNRMIKYANDSLIIAQADFTMDVEEGCAPLVVNFTNATLPTSNIALVGWNFNLGALNMGLNTQMNPSYTYTVPGVYQVKLIVTSLLGCQTEVIKTIKVGSPQNAAFHLDTNIACGSYLVSCFNTSTNSSLINSFEWNFGDGTYSDVYQPQHLFRDTGYLDISLSVGYNGCFDTTVVDSAIYIKAPILSYNYAVNCDTPNIVTFSPSSLGGTNFSWDFGDGSPIDSISWSVTHQFAPTDSSYNVVFHGADSNTGCSYTNDRQVNIRYLQGKLISSDSLICKGEQVISSTTTSVNTYGPVEWATNGFSNLFEAGDTAIFTYNQKGVNTVNAIVHDINGCADTMSLDMFVYKPVARMSASSNVGCTPLSVQFSDISLSDTNIVSWAWNFDDGTTSSLQNPAHTFTSPLNETFNVSLMVTDTFGCVTSVQIPSFIQTKKPNAFFNVDDVELCAQDTVKFYNVPVGDYAYVWNFGDGDTSSLYEPNHLYQAGGNYSISLQVTDTFGCSNSFSRPNIIQVHSIPDANFTANKLSTTCYPASVVFTNSNSKANTQVWEWSFGDTVGTVFTNGTVAQHLYQKPGLFTVSLKGTTMFGCSDSVRKTHYVNIQGPTAQIDVNPLYGCVDEQLNFDVTGTNPSAEIFTWDFGDGNLQTVKHPKGPIPHSYSSALTYGVTMLVSDSSGQCIKTDEVDINIVLVESGFTMSKNEGCTPVKLNLKSTAVGANNQLWIMDKLNSYVGNQITVNLVNPGLQKIDLVVWNDSLTCSDTLSKWVEVFPLPTIVTSPDTFVCMDESTQLLASGASTYSWSPSDGLSKPNISNPILTSTQDMKYTVTGTDSNNCVNTASINVSVVPIPVVFDFPENMTMYQGTEFRVPVSTSADVFYHWVSDGFLSCDSCAEPFVMPDVTTEYTLIYGDTFGCFVSDTSFVAEVIDFTVFIPNSFSPNSDGQNDIFMAETDGVEGLMYMYVYDYWGNLVFENTNLDTGWDGTQNGQLCSSNTSFVYKMKFIGYSGKTAEYMGTVNLIY
jgi:gliding motility-associated-like protein